MTTTRRGLLVALVGLPLAPWVKAPATIYAGGLDGFIRSNAWDAGPPLTEAAFIDFLDHAFIVREMDL